MSRLISTPGWVFWIVFAGCTSGTDNTIPPTYHGLDESDGIRPELASGLDTPQELSPNLTTGIFQAEFVTTEGKFLVEVNRAWAPIGADRFYKLVQDKFFDDSSFFRVVPGFVVQFGLAADPVQNEKWSTGLQDEPVLKGNKRGFLTFAKSSAPNSRTTQLFISYGDNDNLDGMGFSAFGQVIQGMEVVDRINSEYGERPNQGYIKNQGNSYLSNEFPNLSYIQTARITLDDLKSEERNQDGTVPPLPDDSVAND
ncbi:MAG: peptidylprolyl isomerase [Fuerstiella sp.]|nr:peptidylprolyl isomerase [Fuerstiella sp.]